MGKMDAMILVVKRGILFQNDNFEGFLPAQKAGFEKRILKNYEYIRRGDAEHNFGYKQPIGYGVIVNFALKKVYAYQRAQNDSQYSEKRLQGKWSWGIGGHIEKEDGEHGNPIIVSMMREAEEEVSFIPRGKPRLLGYINYDTDSVGKVHFGMLYVFETVSEQIHPNDGEITKGAFYSLSELDKLCSDSNFSVEEWSRIALPHLKKILR